MKKLLLILAMLLMSVQLSAQTAHYTKLSLGPDLCVIQTGSGDPNGAVSGNTCDTYLQTNGTAGATLWISAGTTVWNKAVTALAESAITFTDITTNDATSSQHGYMPKLSGNAFDLALGNGTYGQTVAAGTLSSSKPWVWTQTWNSGGTVFEGFKIAVTNTASAANSGIFEVLGGAAGTSKIFCVGDGVTSCQGSTWNLAIMPSSAQIQSTLELLVHNQVTVDVGRYFQVSGRTYWHAPSTMDFAMGSNTGGVEVTVKAGAAPTLTSGWGTGATINGTNSAGRITIGTTPGASGVLTFSQAWTTNAPACFATDETTGVVVPAVSTTAAVTVTGTFVASDKVSYICFGWQ